MNAILEAIRCLSKVFKSGHDILEQKLSSLNQSTFTNIKNYFHKIIWSDTDKSIIEMLTQQELDLIKTRVDIPRLFAGLSILDSLVDKVLQNDYHKLIEPHTHTHIHLHECLLYQEISESVHQTVYKNQFVVIGSPPVPLFVMTRVLNAHLKSWEQLSPLQRMLSSIATEGILLSTIFDMVNDMKPLTNSINNEKIQTVLEYVYSMNHLITRDEISHVLFGLRLISEFKTQLGITSTDIDCAVEAACSLAITFVGLVTTDPHYLTVVNEKTSIFLKSLEDETVMIKLNETLVSGFPRKEDFFNTQPVSYIKNTSAH